VLLSGAAYYAKLGFVWAATGRERYFELLSRGLRGQLPVWPDQTNRALLCYYLSQVCNFATTTFTPMPNDFSRWCSQAPGPAYAEPAVQDILRTIDENVPFNWVRHERNLMAESAAPFVA
jgi:hypothetical protein